MCRRKAQVDEKRTRNGLDAMDETSVLYIQYPIGVHV